MLEVDKNFKVKSLAYVCLNCLVTDVEERCMKMQTWQFWFAKFQCTMCSYWASSILNFGVHNALWTDNR